MKLGKQAARRDPRTLLFSAYADTSILPTAPPALDRSTLYADWGMLGNDTAGDCTDAAAAHLEMLWAAAHGKPLTIPPAAVIAAYSAQTGYDPATGANDNGAVELDVLKSWRTAGIAGNIITAFAALDHRSPGEIHLATYLFGGVYAGLALPLSASDQIQAGQDWMVAAGPRAEAGSWGGHAVPIVGYDSIGLCCITWGKPQWLTWEFWRAYADEAYAVISPQWASYGITTPEGFRYDQLITDLKALAAA